VNVSNTATVGAVIVAAGSGTRFGDADKVFAPLGGRPLLDYSARLFAADAGIGHVVIVLGAHTLERGQALAKELGERVSVVIGGATRTDSVRAGVLALDPSIELVAVHDAARPLVSSGLLRRLIDAAVEVGAAIPAVPLVDTVYLAGQNGALEALLDRSRLRAAQTPQLARRDWLMQVLSNDAAATDEGSLLHAAGYPVQLIEGEPENLKITLPRDLLIAEAILTDRERVPERKP
jgi:2-C-methyl-D-erythritol 4-phosphate cytidylyltransferase